MESPHRPYKGKVVDRRGPSQIPRHSHSLCFSDSLEPLVIERHCKISEQRCGASYDQLTAEQE